jgi:hypothetical protein
MDAPLTSHARVGEGHDRARLRPGQSLQTRRTGNRKQRRLAGEILDAPVAIAFDRLEQALSEEEIAYLAEGPHGTLGPGRSRPEKLPQKAIHRFHGLRREASLEQTLGIVERGTEDLPAGNLPERGGNAALHEHLPRINDLRRVAAPKHLPVAAQDHDGLVHVTFRLLQGQSGGLRSEQRRLTHHLVDEQPELRAEFLQSQRRGARGNARPLRQSKRCRSSLFRSILASLSHQGI